MFRQRLTLVLGILALAALLQGALAWWAIEVAATQVQRGRVASDLLKGHLELAATKQRLRTWTSQALLQAYADEALRDKHIKDIHLTLERLEMLAQQASLLDSEPARAAHEWTQRSKTLMILRRSVAELEHALAELKPLPRNADPKATWEALNQVFDSSQGKDLRTLVADTITHEQAAVARERAAADRSLKTLAGGVVLATVLIALVAVLVALYFARALRRPLDDLTEGVLALQHGDLAHRIPEGRHDEFAAVSRTFNAMAVELQQHREREVRVRQDLELQVKMRTRELEQALDTLQQLDASRRRLFADISHELRTPTTAIRGEAEIALRGRPKTPEDYQDALRRIVDTATQLGRVIDDLLTMARSDAESLSVHMDRVDARVPVQEALQQAQPLAAQHGVQVCGPAPLSEPVWLWGDGPRLRQLVMLLLDNAIRYSREGGQVELSASLDPASMMWTFEVLDQGIGISEEDLPLVFERNYRSPQARLHRADGSGLGLPLARTLAKAHGGQLSLRSTPGQGTRATLRLPVWKKEQA